MRKILCLIILGFVIISPTPLQAQGASAGGGGAIVNFDPKNFVKESEQLKKAYETYQKVQQITQYQKMISESLGAYPEVLAYYNLLGNLANTICNTRFPPFFFNSNFPFKLPDFPRDPCDIARTFLPFDTNYYSDAVVNVNDQLNDPKKIHQALTDPRKARSIMREMYFLSPALARDVNAVLVLRAKREEGVKKQVSDNMAVAVSASANTPEKIITIQQFAETKPEKINLILTQMVAIQAENAKTSAQNMDLLARLVMKDALAETRNLDPVDPDGATGRLNCTNGQC